MSHLETLVCVIIFIYLLCENSQLSARIRVLEGPPPEPSERVRELLRNGEKLEALKQYRKECPRVALRESKEDVDRLSSPT